MARRWLSGSRTDGFTVTEMLVVLMIIGLVAAIAVPNVSSAIRRAEEAALRENLQVMRRALDAYLADKGEYPDNLDDLVAESYLRGLPADPVAERGVDWQVERDADGGILNIHSASQDTGMNDVAYSQW